MIVSRTPASLSRNVTTTTATTGAGYVTVEGGAAPYTCLWERVSGSTRIVPSNPTLSSTSFTNTGSLLPEDSFTAVYRCKVTSATGEVAYSPTVSVQISRAPLG